MTLFIRAVALLLIGVSEIFAQTNTACSSIVVPGGLFQNGMYVLGMKEDQIRIRFRGQTLSPVSVAIDRSPKRIVLVMDSSSRLNESAVQIVSVMTGYLLAKARPEDSFALLTYGGPAIESDFSASRDELNQKLGYFSQSNEKRPVGRDLISALAQAIKMLGAPRFGDSILLFAGGTAQTDSATSQKSLEALSRHGVRVFAVVLSQRSLSGMYYVSSDFDVPMDPDTVGLRDLAMRSGGMIHVENTQRIDKEYQITPERLTQLQNLLFQWYGAMHLPYRVEIPSMPGAKTEKLEITLAEHDAEKKHRLFTYPALITACANR